MRKITVNLRTDDIIDIDNKIIILMKNSSSLPALSTHSRLFSSEIDLEKSRN